ncbi:MAG: DUF4153 domain-containing protein [Treponemataceae bacterium]
MSNLKSRVKYFLQDVSKTVFEHKTIFATSVLTFLSCCFLIFSEDKSTVAKEVLEQLIKASFFATLISLPVSLLTENFLSVKKYSIQILATIASGLLAYFASSGFGNSVYKNLYYFGLFGFATLITIFIFIPKEKSKTYFACLLKNFLFTLLMSGILAGGLSILVAAFENLIYMFPKAYRVYYCCIAFSFTVFFVNVFSYFLFSKRNEKSSGKAVKIIFLYILFPLYYILLLLLYTYLIKSLILWKLPQGQINWFVSFACVFYFIFYFVLREYDEIPAVKLFYKYGAIVLIPLICIQVIAFFIRVNAYGFTGYRFSSLLFIIFSAMMVAISFVKKLNFEKTALCLLSAFVLFASCTPCNLIDVAYKSQFSRMEKILYKYEIYDGEKLLSYDVDAFDAKITDSDREKLFGAVNYLRYETDKKKPAWFETQVDADKSYRICFGISQTPKDTTEIRFDINNFDDNKTTFDIANFSTMYPFIISDGTYTYDYENKENKRIREIKSIVIKGYDLTDYLLDMVDKKDPPKYIDFPTGTRIYFTHIYFRYDTVLNEFKYYNLKGYVLEK